MGRGRRAVTLLAAASAVAASLIGGQLARAGSGGSTPVVLYNQYEEQDYYVPAGGAQGELYPASDFLNGQICRVPATYTTPTGAVHRSRYGGDLVTGSDVPTRKPPPNGWSILRPVPRATRSHFFTFKGQTDSFGCAFDRRGDFIGTDEGGGNPFGPNGTLVMFFAPDYARYCTLATGLPQPGLLALDGADNLLMPEAGSPTAGGGRVSSVAWSQLSHERPGHCRRVTLATFISDPTFHTPIAIVRDPTNENWIVDSVLGPQEINEYDQQGQFVRTVLPPGLAHYPVGMAVADGWLYYVDLGLGPNASPTDPIDTANDQGAVYRLQLNAPVPVPQVVASGLTYPDGIAVYPSSQLQLPPDGTSGASNGPSGGPPPGGG